MTDEELKQIVVANAQAIQALSRDISQLVSSQQEAAAERQELREAIIKLTQIQEGIANLLSSIDEERPTILRKLTTIENKVDRILEQREGS
ncbi:MAG: hypothetical protein AB4426_35645 [Xenococcaceae cyanobacterium]